MRRYITVFEDTARGDCATYMQVVAGAGTHVRRSSALAFSRCYLDGREVSTSRSNELLVGRYPWADRWHVAPSADTATLHRLHLLHVSKAVNTSAVERPACWMSKFREETLRALNHKCAVGLLQKDESQRRFQFTTKGALLQALPHRWPFREILTWRVARRTTRLLRLLAESKTA